MGTNRKSNDNLNTKKHTLEGKTKKKKNNDSKKKKQKVTTKSDAIDDPTEKKSQITNPNPSPKPKKQKLTTQTAKGSEEGKTKKKKESSTPEEVAEKGSKKSQSPKPKPKKRKPAEKNDKEREEGTPKKKKIKSNAKVEDLEVIVPSSSTEPKEQKDELKRSEKDGEKKEKKKRKNEGEGGDEKEESKICVFPMNRIRKIVKSAGSDLRMMGEAYFLINKASEKFIEQLCEDAYKLAGARNWKRGLKYHQLSPLVAKEARYEFLSDFAPEKVTAQHALAEAKSLEMQSS